MAAGTIAGATLPGLGDRRRERPTTLPERRQDLQGRLDGSRDFRSDIAADRPANRQDLQQRRQDFQNQRREDWQNWHDDHHWHHDGWHHGYWHGHWGGWWDHMWNEHPVAAALGVTWWGVNRLSTWYGFPYYSNPYYEVPAQPTVINYSEPPVIVYEQAAAAYAPADPGAAASPAASLPPGVTQAGVEKFDQARADFKMKQANVEALRRRYYRLMTSVVVELRDGDGARTAESKEARHATLFIFGMLNWVFMWYTRERYGPVEKLGEEMLDLVLNGLRGSVGPGLRSDES